MEILAAKNFNDHVAVIASESPHALVLDWWRRLDLALRDYGHSFRPVIDHQDRHAIEQAVSQDLALGPEAATLICELRHLRNQVAHESTYLSCKDAAAHARQAFSLIAVLARRVSELEVAP